MMKALDVMTYEVVSLTPEMPVAEVARVLRENHLSGAPVIDDSSRLLGIVTEIDLIKRHARVHFPIYLPLLEGRLFLESPKHYQEEIHKALGTTAQEVMTTPARTVKTDTEIQDIATMMVEERLNPLPVLDGNGKLVGIISHTDLIRLIEKAEA
jgi:CBS-domain-containing membrane protein